MRAVAILLLAVGCKGGSDSDTGTPGGTDTDPGGTTPADPCGTVPSYDVTGMDCAQLGEAWEDVIEAADSCTTASDCVAIHPDCTRWNEVGCWYAANKCLTPSEPVDYTTPDDFAGRIATFDCSAPNAECECGGPPELDCVAGKCQFVYGSY
jgi:hypothetical protein